MNLEVAFRKLEQLRGRFFAAYMDQLRPRLHALRLVHLDAHKVRIKIVGDPLFREISPSCAIALT
jgi:hypothetical protein